MTIIGLLKWASMISAVLMIVLAVARGVPLLHLLVPPDERAVWPLTVPLGAIMAVGVYFQNELPGRLLLCTGWALGLAYVWWTVAWHLKVGR